MKTITPYKTDAIVPYTITGPAMTKIFAPTPRINPSVLNSIAGDTTAFANPVIGTKVPAPAYFAILSYTLNPVSSALIATSDIDVKVGVTSTVAPKCRYNSIKSCPMTHIIPPTANAAGIVFMLLVLGEASIVICAYVFTFILLIGIPFQNHSFLLLFRFEGKIFMRRKSEMNCEKVREIEQFQEIS